MYITVKGINEFGKGFIVHYTLTTPCGCSVTRHALQMNQTNKPTKEQAKQAIQDEINNK